METMTRLNRTLVALFVLLTAAVFTRFASAQSAYRSVKTVHFNVKYQRDVSEEDANKVSEYLQDDYKYLSEKLGLDLKKPLEVRIYDTPGKFLSETKLKQSWRAGIYHREVLHLQPVAALVARELLEQTLSYELAKALLEQSSRMGCPGWLLESFAVYHSGEMANLSAPYNVRISNFSDLDQDIQEYPIPPQRNDVHFILGQTMKFFIETYGEAQAFRVFKAFNGTTGLEDVFKKTFKEEFSTIEQKWVNHIASQTSTFRK